jgi:hypothetical protein
MRDMAGHPRLRHLPITPPGGFRYVNFQIHLKAISFSGTLLLRDRNGLRRVGTSSEWWRGHSLRRTHATFSARGFRPRRASRRTSKRSISFAEAWHWSRRYRIRASGPNASWTCKWRSAPPCTRPKATASPTSAEPMHGRGSSVINSKIILVSSRRSAACSSTIRTYSRWRRRSILPRRRFVSPNGLAMRPVWSGGTWRLPRRCSSKGNSSRRLRTFGRASSYSIRTCSSRIGRVPTPACNASSTRR